MESPSQEVGIAATEEEFFRVIRGAEQADTLDIFSTATAFIQSTAYQDPHHDF